MSTLSLEARMLATSLRMLAQHGSGPLGEVVLSVDLIERFAQAAEELEQALDLYNESSLG